MTKKDFVQSERTFTVELLRKLTEEQWQADTLCDGWTVEYLSAHLASRERSLIGGIGLVVPGLHFLHDKRIKRLSAKGHKYILAKLSQYPWWMAATLNTAEFWVHNEDMLRGGLHIARKTPNGEAGEILWQSLKGLVRVKKDMVRDLGNVTLINSQTKDEIHIVFKGSRKQTIISGDPGELLLYFYGRRAAAKVHLKKV